VPLAKGVEIRKREPGLHEGAVRPRRVAAAWRPLDARVTTIEEGLEMLLRGSLSAIAVAVVVALAGCGGDDNETTGAGGQATTTAAPTQQTTTGTTTTGGSELTITMSDFAFTPKDATATAGDVAITAPNTGKEEHELVLVKFAGDPASLPTQANGDVNEDAFAKADLPGEIGETEPGATGTVTVTLPAGRYVMFCNVTGHYKQGMYGTLTTS
jgi:uncharacterized cupredoxin-like copper-binding protein